MKHTPPEHLDYPNIEKCLTKVSEIADYVNSQKRESENLKKMVELKESLVDVPKVNILFSISFSKKPLWKYIYILEFWRNS